MCGIAGVISRSLAPDSARAAGLRMQQALAHRGPDGSGLWQSKDGLATLAHRRLSVLDLSDAASQPMSTVDGRYTISFNGEIYNFRNLRSELEQAGIVFRTTSDTEVILRLYERHGLDCAKHLRGMYAFAIWDAQEQTCALFRDPLGIKLLYLHATATTLAFASELRALVRSELFVPSLNSQGLSRYLESGSVPEPLTLINEAECLPAGECWLWRQGTLTRQTFWRMEFGRRPTSEGDPIAATREALLESVQRHFVSDVPVGLFLSGGIDSTALLALAAITGHRGINAFSVAVDDATADESPIARRTASHFGADYHEMRLEKGNAEALFHGFLSHLDQPTIDGLNTFTVSSLAREHGMKVVLSGLGGDELFGGYASFTTIPKMRRLHQTLGLIPGSTKAAAMVLDRLFNKPQHRRLAEYLRGPGSVAEAYASLRAVFSKSEAAQLAAWISGKPLPPIPSESIDADFPTVADEISGLELQRYMRNQLLRDSDVMSMAHGLELRVPLVDQSLFESVAAIAADARFQPNKRLLTEAVPEVPDWVVNQRKRGFLFPYEKWLDGRWGAAFEEAAQGSPVPVVTWYQKWSLFVLRHCMINLGLRS